MLLALHVTCTLLTFALVITIIIIIIIITIILNITLIIILIIYYSPCLANLYQGHQLKSLLAVYSCSKVKPPELQSIIENTPREVFLYFHRVRKE